MLLLTAFALLIDVIYFSEFVQKLLVAVIQTNDLGEFRAVAPFMLDDLSPNLDLAE